MPNYLDSDYQVTDEQADRQKRLPRNASLLLCKESLTATIWKVSFVHISRVGKLHVISIKNTASV